MDHTTKIYIKQNDGTNIVKSGIGLLVNSMGDKAIIMNVRRGKGLKIKFAGLSPYKK